MAEMKFCKDCAYYAEGQCLLGPSAALYVDSVTGTEVVMPAGAGAHAMRLLGAPCGPAAKLFKSKESAADALLFTAYAAGKRAAEDSISDASPRPPLFELAFARAFLRVIRDGITKRRDTEEIRAMLDKLIGD